MPICITQKSVSSWFILEEYSHRMTIIDGA